MEKEHRLPVDCTIFSISKAVAIMCEDVCLICHYKKGLLEPFHKIGYHLNDKMIG